METASMYFVLGILSIVGVIVLATIVWGIVKINSLLKEVKINDEEISNLNRIIWENHNTTREDFNQQFRDLGRDTYSEFEKRDRDLDLRFKDICDEIAQTRSYIDSRIDKVTGTLSAKQVIKG
jgi:hypothetical protein